MPFYLGDLGQDKTVIAERFQALIQAQGLAGDISVLERDRLYGRRWVKFLRECRCVLGTSSGASVVDFTGEIRRACERHLALRPDASYPEVKARFFADADWKVVIDTVSPRVFEAAALGCTLVQHEGLYGGILRPDEHYICVRRDYSNTADVIDRVQDRGFCREMAKRTHRDLIVSGRYSFQAFARWFDGVLDKHVPGRRGRGIALPDSLLRRGIPPAAAGDRTLGNGLRGDAVGAAGPSPGASRARAAARAPGADP